MRLAWLTLAAAGALALSGCDDLLKEAKPRDAVDRGDRKAQSGDFRGAVGDYEAALDGTAGTADVHYKLALLYDDKLHESRDAMHHLDRYLELAPKGTHAKDAAKIRKEIEGKLALGSARGGVFTQEEAVRLKNDNLQLRKLLAEVRAQKSATPVPASKSGDVATKPIPPGTRTHVVQPGETMASIARKYYKNSERWRDIQDANFYSTSGTPKIKVGQTLIIP